MEAAQTVTATEHPTDTVVEGQRLRAPVSAKPEAAQSSRSSVSSGGVLSSEILVETSCSAILRASSLVEFLCSPSKRWGTQAGPRAGYRAECVWQQLGGELGWEASDFSGSGVT